MAPIDIPTPSPWRGLLRGALGKVNPIIRDLCNDIETTVYQTRALDLITQFHLVCTAIDSESLPPEWNDPGVEQRCERLFTEVVKICTGKSMKDRMDPWPQLLEYFTANNRSGLRKAWRTLLTGGQRDARRQFQTLIKESEGIHGFSAGDSATAHFVPDRIYKRRPHDCSSHFNAGLFNLLQQHVTCNAESPCMGLTVHQSDRRLQHLCRLCLDSCEGDVRERNDKVSFMDVLVSSKDFDYWLEVRLKVQRIEHGIERLRALAPGHFCQKLGKPSSECLFLSFRDVPRPTQGPSTPELYILDGERDFASPYIPGRGRRMSEVLLAPCELSTKDRVLLAHTVALSYYQLYDSELTRKVWTSDSICFMEEKPLGAMENHNPSLTSCLTFDFDTEYNNSPAEQDLEESPVHDFPGILSIGIILLEIAFSKPFPPLPFTGTRLINNRHLMAQRWLADLKKKSWDCFSSKSRFELAVKECLTFKIPEKKQIWGSKPIEQEPREEFYRRVVCHLACLKEIGFKNFSGGRICPRKQDEDAPAILKPQDELRGEFKTGQRLHEKQWLKNLVKICLQVEEQRLQHHVSGAIKVAILDTGCDPSLLRKGANHNMTEWKDFTEYSNEDHRDTHGHGTLMARLVMECAPSAEIIVARIAKDRKGLRGSQGKIAEAIRWAGLDLKANIISMSFGFPRVDDDISRAIEMVGQQRRGRIIFLSSAGNSPYESEGFPANHPSVISIYGADCKGTFSASNPEIKIGGQIALGTFGEDIPSDICDAFEKRFPGICRPGSSIATAVAAGISATMLAYATLLPKVIPSSLIQTSRLQLIWTTEGMEAVLKDAMARPSGEQIQRRFLDPASFWMHNREHLYRLSSILTSLAPVHNRGKWFPS